MKRPASLRMRLLFLVLVAVAGLQEVRGGRKLCPSDRTRVHEAKVPEGFCAVTWAKDVSGPRGIAVATNGDVLVVETRRHRITVLWDADGDGESAKGERAVLAFGPAFSHGIAIDAVNRWLYASTAGEVYRWRYAAGNRSFLGEGEVVVNMMPEDGHFTRTLLVDPLGRLLISVGSASNVDHDVRRAAVFRVELPLQQTLDKAKKQVVHWADATIIASGLRNEVGIDFDAEGRLWGVENGVDRLVRSDMGDIHNDNPAEEVNLIWSPPSPNQEDNNENTFFGYPYCWSEGKLAPLKGEGEGTQWAHPEFLHDGIHTDEWCRNESNVVPPQYWLPAHLAPLDILFYHHQAEGEAGGRKVGSRAPDPSVPMAKRLLPTEWEGDAFVSTHGSWNREITEGRNVLRLHFEDGKPVENSLFFSYGGPPRKIWGHKLVGLALGPCADQKECLFIASDSTNVIFAVGRADL